MSDAKSVLQELQAIVPSGPKFPLQPIIVAAQEEPGMFDSFEAYPWFLMVHRYDAPAPRPSCSLNSTSGSSAPQRPSFWSFGRRRFITAQPARGEGLGIAPETVGSRFLSLLQSASVQTFSAISGTAKKPNCRRHSRARLGGPQAECYGKLLSECPLVSGAWGLADLLYKLFSARFQRVIFVVQPESWYPVRLPFAAMAPTNPC
jgi:hypothetical protein